MVEAAKAVSRMNRLGCYLLAPDNLLAPYAKKIFCLKVIV